MKRDLKVVSRIVKLLLKVVLLIKGILNVLEKLI
jgi:hypothetical protein